ncbi:NUDIX hydrolase domain-like protein [Mycena vulgaris]|nr:NUDIX hydrolase domain-like protein [Mycena vulgaris]
MATFIVSSAVQGRDIPLPALCDEHKGKRVTVGIAIVTETKSKLKKLLLLAYPNMYELPGGNWEAVDTTVLHTVAREAVEETGLVVTRIVHELPGFEYNTRRGPARQLNFIVEVDADGVLPTEEGLPSPTLNPKEHQAYAWVGVGDPIETFPMSKSMAEVVHKALADILPENA